MNIVLFDQHPEYSTAYQPGFYTELAKQARILVVFNQKFGKSDPENEEPRQIAENFWIVKRRVAAPYRMVLSSELAAKLDTKLADYQLKKYARKLGWEADIVEFTSPHFYRHLLCKVGRKRVFWLIDHYSLVPGMSGYIAGLTARAERAAVRNADVVIATARELVKRFSSEAKSIRFLPNAADSDHYQPLWMRDVAVPELVKKYPKPWFGYAGNINPISDWRHFYLLAKHRPQYTFLLMGKLDGPPEFYTDGVFNEAMRLPNVHYLGLIPQEELAALYAHLDCGLVLDAINDFSRTRNQNKIYQYLLAGIPVTGPFAQPDYEPFSELLHLYKDPHDWPALCDDAIASHSIERSKQKRNFAVQIDMKASITHRISIYEAALSGKTLPEFVYPPVPEL